MSSRTGIGVVKVSVLPARLMPIHDGSSELHRWVVARDLLRVA